MRSQPWAQTPLGDPQRWPQSLQTAVRILLTSRFAMWMGWGSDLTFLYNDAYARMTLGVKHPWALGRPARQVWAEIWPQIGPRIENVLTTGTATWDERLLLFLERSGFQEETYHTFSYSPLADDTGRILGLLCVVTEETVRVLGERQLATLRDCGGLLASATEEGEALDALRDAARRHPEDLPFVALYIGEPTARLAVRAGLPDGHALVPPELHGRASDVWPLADVLARGEPRGCDVTLGPDDMPDRPWPGVPSQALLLPLAQQGQASAPGVLVVGLNPHRRLDDSYRGFLTLLAGQLAAGLASARRHAEDRRRAQELEELDRAKTAFFANVSHEFRTPLTLLLGPVTQALQAPDRALAGDDLALVYRNGLRLLKLVNTLLDFARIEAGRVHVNFEPVDLGALTADIASAFRSAMERAGLRYAIDCEAHLPQVHVDRDMWEKVVLNLLSNAFKFTLEGEVRVRLRAEGDGVRLSVSDTGIGVGADDLPHLFERFHRVEGARGRTHEGTGIGLALVQELVRLHGGTIEAESTPGVGTTFHVHLRAGTSHLPADRINTPGGLSATTTGATAFVEEALRWLPDGDTAPGSRPSGASGEAVRIVIADDNADLRRYLAGLLGGLGAVETVADGVGALAALRRAPASLLVSDVMMPNMNGLELVRAVRDDVGLRDTPIILLSARAGEESRAEALRQGADDYVPKPFSAKELVARVVQRLAHARVQREVRGERDRLRDLLSQVPATVNFFRGPDLVFDFAHPRMTTAAGGVDLRGRPLADVVPAPEGQAYIEMLRRVYETGEPAIGREVPFRLDRRATGTREETYWDFTCLPVRSAQGEVEGVMTFDVEVTAQVLARRQVEAQADALAAAHASAQAANRAKDEFLAVLGHELRNPLAPIRTALDVLRLKGVRLEEHDVIERQLNHVKRLVEDLLDVSRITQGKIELRRAVVPVAEVLTRAVEQASPLLEQHSHELVLTVADGLYVDGDPARLAQVVTNLLTNAARYSAPGSPIALSAATDGAGRVEIRVRDRGVGILPEMRERIFDPFVQQAQGAERRHGGLGLGLTIVRSLVEQHGGAVRVESPGPDQGSVFIVTLPAAAALNARGRLARGTGAATEPRAESRGRVLVVDDNADARDMLMLALGVSGYEVTGAADGPEALTAVDMFRPDAVVLDIGLPVMDGYEVARRIRRTHVPAPRLVAVTGYGQSVDRERARQAGFDVHLVKPVQLDALIDALER
ncbi:MAG: ATP-binding protein [Vicinamibacterales bacterium]